MAREFGYTGEPETCVWCGRKLRANTRDLDPNEPVPAGYRETGRTKKLYGDRIVRVVAALKLGAYFDNTFDTLTCGYMFGLRHAQMGHRLQVRK